MTLKSVRLINNDFYDELGDRWYTATDDPVALLRAESRLRLPWILSRMRAHASDSRCQVLDIGCGAGFLSNELAKAGLEVSGIDLSPESLEVARQYDDTGSVRYQIMNAHHLKFEDRSFDFVCAMDFLEHTPDPGQVLRETARVLKPGGIFFFHTFNRNPISTLIAIKGVEWFVKNTPPQMHVPELFIKPRELNALCLKNGLQIEEIKGIQPRFLSKAFWKMLFTGEVPHDFEFKFSLSTLIGYSGLARRQNFMRGV